MPPPVYDQLAIFGLLGFWVILQSLWPSRGAVSPQPAAEPGPPPCKRQCSTKTKPCEGLTKKPPCAAWAHAATHPTPPSLPRPEPRPSPHRRPWAIDTAM